MSGIILSIKGLTPKIGENCFIAPSANIIGEVTMGDQCSIWFNTVIRGDVAPITLGNRVNVQDGTCIHVTNKVGPTLLEDDVSVGHNATLHACTIKKGALIGMGSTVLDNAVVGEGAIVAAGALVLANTQIGDHEIWGGVPAKFIKKTKPHQAEAFADHYVEYAKWYLDEKI